MKRIGTTGLICIALALITTGTAEAQIPDEFTNLEVLPKEISRPELISIMRNFAGGLGVRCSHCHVGPDNLAGMDFATDELAAKKTAREMMRMVNTINSGTLAKIETGRETRAEVSCRTCHRGLTLPLPIDSILETRIAEDGLEKAIATYREMRTEHYGSDAYNFSTTPLNSLAERLARAEQIPEAVALLQLNLEYQPDDAYTHLLLGQIHAAAGEIDKAIASTKEALRRDPENAFAKRVLQRLAPDKEE